MAQQWYYIDASLEKVGPISPQELRTLAQKGIVTPETTLQLEGSSRMVEARTVSGLFETKPATQQTAAVTPSSPPPRVHSPAPVVPPPSAPQRQASPPLQQPYQQPYQPPQQPYQQLLQQPYQQPYQQSPQQQPYQQPLQPPYQQPYQQPYSGQQPVYQNSAPAGGFDFPDLTSVGQTPDDYDPFARAQAATRSAKHTHKSSGSSSGGDGRFYDANALGIGFFDVLIKKYFLFSGRARRKEFWMFFLMQFLIQMFLIFIIFLIAYFAHHSIIEKDNRNALTANVLLANTVWILATMCPTITLQVRRLHDAGYSGWLWLVNLIPYVGGLILLLFMVQDSQRGTNQYGPNPKGEY